MPTESKTTELQEKIDRLRVELANILPLAENWLDAQWINPNKDKSILCARDALEQTKP